MTTRRWRIEGQEGERESRWVSGKSTGGENVEQANLLLALVRDRWSKGGERVAKYKMREITM